jgi:hypothetical protein
VRSEVAVSREERRVASSALRVSTAEEDEEEVDCRAASLRFKER